MSNLLRSPSARQVREEPVNSGGLDFARIFRSAAKAQPKANSTKTAEARRTQSGEAAAERNAAFRLQDVANLEELAKG